MYVISCFASHIGVADAVSATQWGIGSSTSGKSSFSGTIANKSNLMVIVSNNCSNLTNETDCENLVFDCDDLSATTAYTFCSAGEYLVGCKSSSSDNSYSVMPTANDSTNDNLKNCIRYGYKCETCPTGGTSASASSIYLKSSVLNPSTCCKISTSGYQSCSFTITNISDSSNTNFIGKKNTIITINECYSTTGTDATGTFEWVNNATDLTEQECTYTASSN